MRIYFSTLLTLFLITSGFLGLQFIPILRYQYTLDDQDFFKRTGSGWPLQFITEQTLGWPEAVFNAIFLVVVLIWVYLILQKPFERYSFKWVDAVLALVLAGMWFGTAWMASLGPVVTDYSLSIPYKPGWQNGRSALFVFCTSMMAITTIRFLSCVHEEYVAFLTNKKSAS